MGEGIRMLAAWAVIGISAAIGILALASPDTKGGDKKLEREVRLLKAEVGLLESIIDQCEPKWLVEELRKEYRALSKEYTELSSKCLELSSKCLELRSMCLELRSMCTTLRWMLGADRCNRCDEACTMEESGLCPLDERLGALGVPVPGVVNQCHVSQCQEEDR